MKLKPVLMLALLCCCLGAYIFFVDTKKKSTDEILNEEQNVLSFSKNGVDEIAAGNIKLIKNKDSGEWIITEPINAKTDIEQFELFQDSIFSLKYDNKQIIRETEIAQYEIDMTKQLKVTNSATGTETVLYPGKQNFDGSNFIYSKSENAIFKVKSDLKNIFGITLNKLRNKKIFNLNIGNISGFKILRAENDIIELSKNYKSETDYDWQMISPKNLKASWLGANNLLDKILTAEPLDFIDNPEAETGESLKNESSIKIFVKLKEPENSGEKEIIVYVSFSPKKDAVYLRVGDSAPIYRVSPDIIKELNLNYIELKNEKIFGENISPADITEFQIKTKNGELKLQFQNGVPVSADPESNKNIDLINELIHNIQLFKAKRFVSDKTTDLFEYSLDKPELQIFFEIKGIKSAANFSKNKNKFYGVIFNRGDIDIFETETSKDGSVPEFLSPALKLLKK
ncbi:MAG TPA: DUF4340 domain-containing protein [bacterium]|nr:DUF4340 domain-containing protein [bacterium]HPN30202.1 DUF4340 domain-containing protein [bacterium]